MPKTIAIFLLGLAAGFGLFAVVLNRPSQEPRTIDSGPTTMLTNEIEGLKAQLAKTKARLEEARHDNDREAALSEPDKLKATTEGASPPRKKSGFLSMFGDNDTNITAMVMNQIEASTAQETEKTISALTLRLTLTPDQEAAVRALLSQQATKRNELMQKMMQDGMSDTNMDTSVMSETKTTAQIKALLTPEQASAYDDFQKEQKLSELRLMANGELLQLQSTLQLSEEQQDKVFDILVKSQQEESMPQTNASDSASATDYLRRDSERKAEKLRAVLTPEQFKHYQQIQEQELKAQEQLMKDMPGQSNGASHVFFQTFQSTH